MESERLVYNWDTQTLDFRNLRVTDLKDCPKLVLPPPRPQSKEIGFLTKETLWSQSYQRFRIKNCNDKGILKRDPMTKSEIRGKIKLSKRANAGEIVISQSDKSNEITISSQESYKSQGDIHTVNDRLATWKDVEESKKVTLCHTRALTKVLNIGTESSSTNRERLTDALHENLTIVSDMIVQQKTHKPIDPETGLPKTRALCLASATFNQRLNGHLVTILGGCIQTEPNSEAISTEDKISKIDKLNKEISQGKINPKKLTKS